MDGVSFFLLDWVFFLFFFYVTLWLVDGVSGRGLIGPGLDLMTLGLGLVLICLTRYSVWLGTLVI